MKTLFASLFALTSALSGQLNVPYQQIPDRSELEILTPALSERQTAKIRLQNGLEAYLISDPHVDESAAALAVGAGSWDNPDEYPGMAHFLEHMLFMGTEAYPDENDYMQYIGDHGGKINAYTAEDRTVYMFAITNEGFAGAYDRFAHFFIDPLFKQASIQRELLAVDQEHAKNIENDDWRQYMITKETGNQSHPNAQFSTGNAETLGGIPREAMKKWYDENYSSKKMHLVVLSSLPLDQLIELTVQDFSKVPVRNGVKTPSHPNMFSSDQKGHMIYIKPVKDLKTLSLHWEVPQELAKDSHSHTGNMLAYILQSGSKNSLLGQLKKEHLAESIRAGEELAGNDQKVFSISVSLTDKGLEQVNTVITYCYEALARLHKTGIPRYIYNEVEKITTIEYQYQSREPAFGFVMQTAHQMVDEQIETFPRQTFIPSEYQPETFAKYVRSLSPEEGIYFLIADPSKTHVPTTKVEKWMGAEYHIAPIPSKQLAAWSQVSINPQIGLPPPNPFIPQNLELVHATTSEETVIPTLLQDNGNGAIYFAPDQKYATPKVAHIFRLKTPTMDGSAGSWAFGDLYSRLIADQMFPLISAADTAGSSVALRPDHFGFVLTVEGYSDHSNKLVEDFIDGIKKIRCTKEQFEIYKQSLLAKYENKEKELPFLQSMELMQSVLFNTVPTSAQKLEALKAIDYEQFVAFTQDVWKKEYTEGLIYGNLNKADAETLLAGINKKMHAQAYPVAEHKQKQVLALSNTNGPFMIAQSTPMMGNAVMLMVEQGRSTYERRAAQQVLALILKEAFFNTLRTKQQTAYIAKAWDREEENQLMQFFAVQSSTHQPNDLIVRFELFLENFVKQYSTEVPQERFEHVKKMAIAALQMPPENLDLMASKLFLLGFNHDGDFHLVDKRLKALEELTYEKTYEMAMDTLSRRNNKRLAILLEGVIPKEKDFRYEVINKNNLEGIGSFVAWK